MISIRPLHLLPPLLLLLFVQIPTGDAECVDLVASCYRAVDFCDIKTAPKRPSSQRVVSAVQTNCPKTCRKCPAETKPTNPPASNPPSRNPGGGSKKKRTPKKKKKPTQKPVNAPLPDYKLHYFDFRLRGEAARLMLKYKKVKFDDVRIAQATWPTKKATYPNGKVPVLYIDSVVLDQSFAIYQYIGKKFDMGGADEIDTAHLESTAELFRELMENCTDVVQVALGFKTTPTLLSEETRLTPILQNYIPKMEKIIDDQKTGFFGKKLSWVDFWVADFVQTLKTNLPTAMGTYAKIDAHRQKIYDLPGVKEYIATRPVTNA